MTSRDVRRTKRNSEDLAWGTGFVWRFRESAGRVYCAGISKPLGYKKGANMFSRDQERAAIPRLLHLAAD